MIGYIGINSMRLLTGILFLIENKKLSFAVVLWDARNSGTGKLWAGTYTDLCPWLRCLYALISFKTLILCEAFCVRFLQKIAHKRVGAYKFTLDVNTSTDGEEDNLFALRLSNSPAARQNNKYLPRKLLRGCSACRLFLLVWRERAVAYLLPYNKYLESTNPRSVKSC